MVCIAYESVFGCLLQECDGLSMKSLCACGVLTVLLFICPAYGSPPNEGDRQSADAPQKPVVKLSPTVSEFLSNNCLDCHSSQDAEAGFDLERMAKSVSDETFSQWVEVFDRVNDGEMPPKDYADFDADEQAKFLGGLSKQLTATQASAHLQFGRTPARRLTNLELERTLHDLLGVDLPLAELMPEEQRSGGFTNMAAIQSMSHFQLEDHLWVVDTALDEAFRNAANKKNKSFRRSYSARDLARSNTRRRCRDPEMRGGLAVVWSSTLVFYGRVTSTTVRKSGWYRITMKASAVKPPEDGGVWCTVRSGRCNSGAPLMSWIGSFEAQTQAKEMVYEAWLPEGHMIEVRPGDVTLKRARFQGGQVGVGEGEPQNVPGVALHSLILEEIHPAGSPDVTRRNLLGQLPVSTSDGELRIDSAGAKELNQQLAKFASRAFRRSVTQSQLAPYRRMLASELANGAPPIEALRSAYRGLLCSPRFLYLTEPAGKLDDFAIASRLSYMLWGSMPDQELLKLARAGVLSKPETILAQTDRMLKARRGQDFVERFTGQWLDLLDIDFTEPDRKLYRDFDPVVQNAMLDETRQFVQDLLQNNRPAVDLVSAEHTYLNSRLADFYGVDGIQGDQMRRIELDSSSHRGGLLTHGSILKVTANGTNTSPVLRGVWVSERLLGQPIPPPPENVPAIEPDVRGAKTVREMLEKHRADSSCASCHAKIDPPGYALEKFDAAGQWRTSYDKRKKQPIDASYHLRDGREFDGPDAFKQLWKATPEPIARCFAEKLLIFGTGSDITFADREHVEVIVTAAAHDDFGLRTILNNVVTSPVFLSK